LNRVDDIIVFHSLTREDLYRIIDIEVAEVKSRLNEQDVHIELDNDAKELLIEKGFDPVFGARPLKRTIQRFLEDQLAEDIIARKFNKGSKIKVSRKGDHLVFE